MEPGNEAVSRRYRRLSRRYTGHLLMDGYKRIQAEVMVRTEVLRGLGGDVLEQLHDNPPSGATADGDVKENIRPVRRHSLVAERCAESSPVKRGIWSRNKRQHFEIPRPSGRPNSRKCENNAAQIGIRDGDARPG